MSTTLKARLPRGFVDRPAADLAATNRMIDAIRRTYELYGFEALETPFVEYTEALGKFLPDQDRPNEGVFSFQDDDEQWLSLRYDLTAPLARHVAERLDAQSLTLPYRSYRAGWVFRNEKPGPGRFRQFMQFDADTVGSGSPAADAEICMMMADTLEAVGIPRGQYVVKVNNRKVLDGVMEAIGLGGDENAGRRLTVLRALDKADKFPIAEIRKLLGEGRLDESGDFTKGAGLSNEEQTDILNSTIVFERVSDVASAGGRDLSDMVVDTTSMKFIDNVAIAQMLGARARTDVGLKGADELMKIAQLCEAAGYGSQRIQIDPSVVRGLEYYTGPVFEAELTFSITNDEGQTVRFGSVAGGGRYDGLVGRFRAEPVPATGFSIGVSRLLAALQHVKSPIVAAGASAGPAVVLVMDRDRVADYQAMVAKLRRAGIPAEFYLGSAGMKAQMKYADRRRAPCVIIQGSQEKERGEVQIKDLFEGAKAAEADKAAASNAEYRAARLAQVSVSEEALVETVAGIFARHGLKAG
ncbi:histidine--tRNA ligase [Enterovirga rhinocerotis]|uniref:Histidine--tRNA ligase n=1 Tax=Enterovirga rhinocerotis TaxID=1339210 RepID=A0A4R7BQS8_9HYPH|nr:histidine--tRNA ligase [Enterovirga rhinocerotis]TDR88024.1 histidyl-tRNA synthetase [Enterovirga rhinocerotis]